MKKNLFLIPAFLLAFQISKAQTEKGSQTLGVNLSFGYSKQSDPSLNSANNIFTNNDTKNVTFGAGPIYSYFIADKLDLGGSLFYSNSKYDYSSDNSYQRYHSYSASVFLRKYLMFNPNFGIRTGPQLGYQRSVQKNSIGYSSDGTSNAYTGGVNLGFVFYPVKNIGFSATLANLNYAHSNTKYTNGSHSNSDNVYFTWINNDLSLSAFYVFGGK
jgi:hypothetical protein